MADGMDYYDNELYLAVIEMDKPRIKRSLRYGANPNTRGPNGSSLLHRCARSQDNNDTCKIIRCLIKHGCDPNMANSDGQTALHVASQCDNVMIAECLIKHGIYIDVMDESGNTALHYAVRYGNHDMIKLLIHCGADPYARNMRGLMPADLAHGETKRIVDRYFGYSNDYFSVKPAHDPGYDDDDDLPIKGVHDESYEWDHTPQLPSISGPSSSVHQRPIIKMPVSNPQPNTTHNEKEEKHDNEEERECPICFDPINQDNSKVLICGHGFCIVCINKWDNINGTCPMCRRDIQIVVPVVFDDSLCKMVY